MKKWFHVFFVLIMNALAARRDAQVRLLKLQVEILKAKLPGNRVIIDPADRQRLMNLGAEVEHRVQDSLMVVSFKTYQRWLREEKEGKKPKKVGRPRLAQEMVDLIVRLAKENMGWGVKRIAGELKKLGERVGRSSIQRVLKQEGLYPDPDRSARRRPDSTWQNFLALHMNTIVACDFLCKTIWTPLGHKTAYLLMFIHLESRKVFMTPATYAPDSAWCCQQARNLGMWLAENNIHQRFILRDNDTKFSAAFDAVFKAAGVETVRTPIAAPNANSFSESWIGKCQFEALDHLRCFSLGHLDHIAQEYVRFHNEFRPHQSKDNEPLRFEGQPPPARPPDRGKVLCRSMLGGVLKHYYRKAA